MHVSVYDRSARPAARYYVSPSVRHSVADRWRVSRISRNIGFGCYCRLSGLGIMVDDVTGCVYCLKAYAVCYALCYWLRLLTRSVRTLFLAACTSLKRAHYVPACVYCEVYALYSWLRLLTRSVRTLFLAACTSLKRTHYVPDCVYCEVYALCSRLRLPLSSVRTLFLSACIAFKAYTLRSWLRVPPFRVQSAMTF